MQQSDQQIRPQTNVVFSKRQWFNKITLRIQLIVVFMLFAIVPLGIGTYINIHNIRTIQANVLLSGDDLNSMDEQVFLAQVIFVLGIVSAVIIAFNLARWLTTPLTELIITTRQIASGALGVDIPVSAQYEAGDLAISINNLVNQLRHSHEGVEQRINQRTDALETVVRSLEISTNIGRQMTTILDIDELLQYVVDHIRIEFDFDYCTKILLVEEETGDLVLTQASGEVGEQLKAEGFHVKTGEGIIGMVAKTNEYFLSNDVRKSSSFSPHPLLPETRSELAIPLRKAGRVLGVLDIQSRHVDRFLPTDVPLMQSIANQTAIVIENARLLTETQTALEEVERLNRRLTREGWQDVKADVAINGYRFSNGISSALTSGSDFWLPPMKQAASNKKLIKQTHSINDDASKAELAVPLILRGEVIGVLGVKREETEDWAEEEVSAIEAVANQITRALENARLSKEQEKTIEQLKEVDRVKSEFLTSMSHELRTPLNSIIGFADVIIQGIDGKIPDMALNDVNLIHSSGQHLLALINDILDISKIEAGMMELVCTPLDIHESLEDVLAASTSLIKNKSVEIITKVEDQLPRVYADKLRLNQILLNLVSNAAKFTHKGTITISAKFQAELVDKMYISVTDTGIGIPVDKMEAIFDRFRQADSSTTREYGGTGLGLAICKQLVEMHGGELSLTSEVGVGSEFYFTIPLTKTDA